MVFPVVNSLNKTFYISDFHTDILVMIFKLAEENLKAILTTCKTFNRVANIVSSKTLFTGMMSRHLIIKIDQHWNAQLFRKNELILVKGDLRNSKTTIVRHDLNQGVQTSVELKERYCSIGYDEKRGYFSTYFLKGDITFIDFNNQSLTPSNLGENSYSLKDVGLQLQMVGNHVHLIDRAQIVHTWNSHPRLRNLQYTHFCIHDETKIILKCSDYNVFVFPRNGSDPIIQPRLRKYHRMQETSEGYLAAIPPPYSKDDTHDPWIIDLLNKDNFTVIRTFFSEVVPFSESNYLLTLNHGIIGLHDLVSNTSHKITSTKGRYFNLSLPFIAIVKPGFTHDNLEIWNVSARVRICTKSFFGNIHHVSLSKEHVLVQTDNKVHIFTMADLKVSDKVDSYYVVGFWQSLINFISRIMIYLKDFFNKVIPCQ